MRGHEVHGSELCSQCPLGQSTLPRVANLNLAYPLHPLLIYPPGLNRIRQAKATCSLPHHTMHYPSNAAGL